MPTHQRTRLRLRAAAASSTRVAAWVCVYLLAAPAGCRAAPGATVPYTHVVGTAGRAFDELSTVSDYGVGVGGYVDANAASPVDGKVVGYEYFAVAKRPFIVRHLRVMNNLPEVDIDNVGGLVKNSRPKKNQVRGWFLS